MLAISPALSRKTGIRITEIETLDKISILVPNSELIEKLVVNWSHGSPVSRLHVPFGVAYGSSIEDVRAAALAAARHHPKVLRYPKPEVWFQGFGDSSLLFDLLIWIREPWNQPRIKSESTICWRQAFVITKSPYLFPSVMFTSRWRNLARRWPSQTDAPIAADSSGNRGSRERKHFGAGFFNDQSMVCHRDEKTH